MRWPVHASAVGKALLAFLPNADRQKIVKEIALRRLTPRTITSAAALEKQFQEFRRSGFCWEFSEGETNVACVAAPVFGPDHEVLAAVSITGTTHQITRTKIRPLGRVVKRYAQQMSTRLGDESK
jgi:IclR family acetate operon transcriptional repressor